MQARKKKKKGQQQEMTSCCQSLVLPGIAANGSRLALDTLEADVIELRVCTGRPSKLIIMHRRPVFVDVAVAQWHLTSLELLGTGFEHISHMHPGTCRACSRQP
jgi:hypothetical protein